MIRAIFASVLAVVVTSVGAVAQSRDAVSFEAPETVELAMVVTMLSELDPGGQSVQRSGPYAEAVTAHFAPHTDHPLFEALGDSFNLPRLAGNAADFAFNEEGQIIEIDDTGSLWGDTDGDLFRRHLALLQDFADQSDFLAFYEAQQPVYNAALSDLQAQTDSAGMTAWLEDNFTARPGPMRIIVSPLIDGFNWGTLFKPQTRIWVAPPVGGTPASEKSDYDRVNDGYSVFTELDHSYVNPATTLILDQVEPGFSQLDEWAGQGTGARAYATAELQFNEYMTWAVYLMYAADQLPAEAFGELKEEFVSFMVDRRGFIAFDDFADEALRLFQSGMTAEETMPVLAAWARDYVDVVE